MFAGKQKRENFENALVWKKPNGLSTYNLWPSKFEINWTLQLLVFPMGGKENSKIKKPSSRAEYIPHDTEFGANAPNTT